MLYARAMTDPITGALPEPLPSSVRHAIMAVASAVRLDKPEDARRAAYRSLAAAVVADRARRAVHEYTNDLAGLSGAEHVAILTVVDQALHSARITDANVTAAEEY